MVLFRSSLSLVCSFTVFCGIASSTFAVEYHSQLGQDKWVAEDVYQGKRGGYFVDIGATDGVKFSNTLALERDLGWQGLCIEPSQQAKSLAATRTCTVSQTVVADQSGLLVNFMEDDVNDPDFNMFSGIVEHFDPNALHKGTVTERVTKSLAALFDLHGVPEHIDYLTIDTEGSEYIILKNFPFERYSFGAITVEHNLMEPKRSMIHDLLSSNGYTKVAYVGHDDYYLLGDGKTGGGLPAEMDPLSSRFTVDCESEDKWMEALWDFASSEQIAPAAAVTLSERISTACSAAGGESSSKEQGGDSLKLVATAIRSSASALRGDSATWSFLLVGGGAVDTTTSNKKDKAQEKNEL